MSQGRPRLYDVADFFRAAGRQRAHLEEQLRQAEAESASHASSRAALTAQATTARRDLAQSLLPGLVADRVARARDLVGFAPWRSEDPIRQMNADRAAVERRLAEIAADPLYVQSELLFHPRTGTHTRELAEVEGHHATQVAELTALTAHPRFQHLVAVGYGTERYDVPFWRVSYYDDWEAHDEIVEAFPGSDFPSLARRYEAARAAEETLRAEIARLRALVAHGRALWDEHAALTRRLATLSGEHLAAAQARLVEHVLTSHGATMRAALARDPAILGLYLRASALDAKLRYLDHVFLQDVGAFRDGVARQIAKLDRDLVKYGRPKNAGTTFLAEPFERRFADRGAAHDKHWTRYRKRYVGLWAWSDWDDVPDDDFVWWDVMTDGRPDGDTIPEVADFRRRHGRPTWLDERSSGGRRAHDDDHDFATAAAVAAGAGSNAGTGGVYATHDLS